jgi:fatty acid desaturase
MASQRIYAEDRFGKIDPSKLQELSRPDYSKGIGLLTFDWLVIIAATAGCLLYFNPITFLIAWLIIGGRMMGLWTLLHDGHHHMLLPNRKLNRMLTQIFIAWPLFKSLSQYDNSHGNHHRFLGTEKDPNVQILRYNEFQFPMSKSKFRRILTMDLLGINAIRYFILKRLVFPYQRITKRESNFGKEIRTNFERFSVGKTFYWIAILGSLFYFGFLNEFFLFWVIPSITWFSMMFRLTTVSDHCFAEAEPTHRTRTVLVNWFEAIFMAPHNLNYHVEHHTYGSVPCYNLGKLHKHLMNHDWFRSNATILSGYGEVFRILTTNKGVLQK